MTKNLDKEGLRSIAENYDLFFIDLWGVVHNGIKLHEKAIETLVEIDKSNKKYVLLTNAPRPNSTVKNFKNWDDSLRAVLSCWSGSLIFDNSNFIFS